MRDDWKQESLEDLISIKHGYAFKGEFFTDEKTISLLVTPGNFSTSGQFQNTKPKYYKGPIPEDYILATGDLLVTMTDLSKKADTLGYGATVPNDENIWLHNQRIGLINILDDTKLSKYFLSYLFKSPKYRHFIVSSATGTTVKHTSPKRILKFEFKLPPLTDQKAIAHILGTLDDKIELNRKMNETLEEMAQALFKSWFVDLDPVLDKALTAGHEIPDALKANAEKRKALGDKRKALPQEIADLFPDRFVFTEELGWIPEGWEENEISFFCEKIQNGGTPKRDKSEYWDNGVIPWLTSGEVRESVIIDVKSTITEKGLKESSAKYVGAYSSLVAMYGATAGQVSITSKEITTNQAVCSLIPKPHNEFFIYLNLRNKIQYLENQARGSAQQNISKGIIESTKVFNAGEPLIVKFNSIIRTKFDQVIKNKKQTQLLSQMRDTLLPKLISGELRVPENLNYD